MPTIWEENKQLQADHLTKVIEKVFHRYLEPADLRDLVYADVYLRRIRKITIVQLTTDSQNLKAFLFMYDNGREFVDVDFAQHRIVLDVIEREQLRRAKLPWTIVRRRLAKLEETWELNPPLAKTVIIVMTYILIIVFIYSLNL